MHKMTLYKKGSTVSAPNHHGSDVVSFGTAWEALRCTMPKDKDGFIKGLEYVPKHRQQWYWEQWREWLKQHPKADWPEWCMQEIERRKAKVGA